jgi:hypothetical protein
VTAVGDRLQLDQSTVTMRYLKSFQNIDPTLRCRPDFVHGMPVARETRRFAFVIPVTRFQLKPPLVIALFTVSLPQRPDPDRAD